MGLSELMRMIIIFVTFCLSKKKNCILYSFIHYICLNLIMLSKFINLFIFNLFNLIVYEDDLLKSPTIYFSCHYFSFCFMYLRAIYLVCMCLKIKSLVSVSVNNNS